MVKVRPDIEIELEKQYMLKYNIRSNPDSILVNGPKHIADTLKYVYTKNEKLQQLNRSVTIDISLKPMRNVTFSVKKVRLIIPVEQYTESSLNIPILVLNTPDSIIIKTFPSSVDVLFNICLSDFNKINPALFEVAADYKQIVSRTGEESDRFLDIEINRYPDYVQAIRVNPKKVEYIIENND